MALGMFMIVKVMLSLISVMSLPPCLCSLPVCMVVGIFDVLAFCVSFVSCIVMMYGRVLFTRFLVS